MLPAIRYELKSFRFSSRRVGETHLSFPSPQVPAVLTNAPGDGERKVFICWALAPCGRGGGWGGIRSSWARRLSHR